MKLNVRRQPLPDAVQTSYTDPLMCLDVVDVGGPGFTAVKECGDNKVDSMEDGDFRSRTPFSDGQRQSQMRLV